MAESTLTPKGALGAGEVQDRYAAGHQQARDAAELQLPEWQRNSLDLHRMAIARDAAEHPAIMQRLDMLEAKLDTILTILTEVRTSVRSK